MVVLIDKNICCFFILSLASLKMLVFACSCVVILDYFIYSGQMVRLWSGAEETPLSDEMMRIHPDVLNRFPLNEVMA